MIKYLEKINRVDELDFKQGESFKIVLQPKENIDEEEQRKKLHIFVKKYMTQQATPTFDFMKKWNNNKPMPSNELTGIVTKETRGMLYIESDKWSGWVIKPAITEMEELS